MLPFTLTELFAGLGTVCAGSSFIVDIIVEGVTVLSTQITIEAGANKSYLVRNIEFTNDLQAGYHQVKICRHSWAITDYDKDTVVEKLNASLGIYLDTQYPLWERSKHSGEGNYINWAKTEPEGLSQDQIDRKAYIDSVYAWITQCRTDRDTKENEYVNNGTFPSFEWTDRPDLNL